MSTSTDIQKILSECADSVGKTAKVFFPDRFYRPFGEIHRQIFPLLEDDSIQRVAIAAPRGFGKTSIINLAFPAQRLLFRKSRFILQISETADLAEQMSDNLKVELTSNQDISEMFGDVKGTKWTSEVWDTAWEARVRPRGAGQQVRGNIYRNNRPDLIIVDDLENSEKVCSSVQREKLYQWFITDLCNSVDRGRSDWKIVVIGTILHEDSLLQRLLEDDNWTSIRLSLCDEEYHSNWPDWMSDKAVEVLADQFRKVGKLDEFYREYMNLPIDTEDPVFKQSYFVPYDEPSAQLWGNHDVETAILVEPAKTVKQHSDFTAILAVGVNLRTNEIFCRDVCMKRLHPDEIVHETFNMADAYGAKVIGIEVNSLNEFITFPFRNEMQRLGRYYELVELKPRGQIGAKGEGKNRRIEGLAHLYRQGLIKHNCTGVCRILEQQLMAFPRSRYDDVMDCFAYIIELLDMGHRYFQPIEDVPETYEEIESEYEDLERGMDAELLGWRI